MIGKIVLIVLAVAVVGFLAIQIFAMSGQKGIETYPYQVEKKYEDFEIRRYESSLFTSVKIDANGYETGSSKGFSVLGGYIFGANEKKEKIAMTSPVTMSLEDSMTMMFMVPKEYNKDDLPRPDQKNIDFVQMPEKVMAAVTFGGWANDEKIEKYKQKLIAALDAEGIPYSNRFYVFGYNAPYEVFNRKNEVVVELAEGSSFSSVE